MPCGFSAFLPAGYDVVCGVEIVNSGNVGLNDTTVTAQTADCPVVLQLAPGQVHQCNMIRPVPQAEFDAWDANGTRVALAVDITALPTGVVAVSQISNHTNGSTVLVSRPSFNVTDVTVAPVSVLNAGVSLDSVFHHAKGVLVCLQLLLHGHIVLCVGCSPCFCPQCLTAL